MIASEAAGAGNRGEEPADGIGLRVDVSVVTRRVYARVEHEGNGDFGVGSLRIGMGMPLRVILPAW